VITAASVVPRSVRTGTSIPHAYGAWPAMTCAITIFAM
jgi:hypothetical protein